MIRTSNTLRLILLALIFYACLGILIACSSTRPIGQQQSVSDTVQVQVLQVEKIRGAELLPIGGSIQIPDMDIEIVRFSETEALVKTPVRREVRTDFVPVRNEVRITDKSRTKSRTDNRTYSDSFNEDKGKTNVRTVDRTVDKSRTDSGNRTKTVDKDITRNGFPWWIIILATALGGTGWLARKYFKLPWIK